MKKKTFSGLKEQLKSYRRSLQPAERTSDFSNDEISSLFFFFVRSLLPGYGWISDPQN
jgi:hypothetical protein